MNTLRETRTLPRSLEQASELGYGGAAVRFLSSLEEDTLGHKEAVDIYTSTLRGVDKSAEQQGRSEQITTISEHLGSAILRATNADTEPVTVEEIIDTLSVSRPTMDTLAEVLLRKGLLGSELQEKLGFVAFDGEAILTGVLPEQVTEEVTHSEEEKKEFEEKFGSMLVAPSLDALSKAYTSHPDGLARSPDGPVFFNKVIAAKIRRSPTFEAGEAWYEGRIRGESETENLELLLALDGLRVKSASALIDKGNIDKAIALLAPPLKSSESELIADETDLNPVRVRLLNQAFTIQMS